MSADDQSAAGDSARSAAGDSAPQEPREPAAPPRKPPPKPIARLGGTFLSGASGRLLPASVPFRWFGAAIVFHALAWVALAAGAGQWSQWHGGLGWPLAALHLVTLGTLVATAIGASLQLLPVATRQPVHWPHLIGLMWWLFVPGMLILAFGMGLAHPRWLEAGAGLVIAVLLAWGTLLGLNLRGARGMPGVVLHGWGTAGSLLLLALSAAALVALWNGHAVLARDTLAALHLALGVFGVMGLLALGLSTILLPMFALGPVPADRLQQRAGAAALLALGLAVLAAFWPDGSAWGTALRLGAVAVAALALAWHVRMMRATLAAGMRKELGRAGRLTRIGWALAALALALALAKLLLEAVGHEVEALGPLFVVAAVGGWLLSFLFGMLQRIVPFLAAMHAARGRKRPPTPSALTLESALAVHFYGHLSALALLALAIVTRSGVWLLAASLAGLIGALAFGLFFAVLLRRLRRAGGDAVAAA